MFTPKKVAATTSLGVSLHVFYSISHHLVLRIKLHCCLSDCFSMIILCKFVQAKHFFVCVGTTAESRAKIWPVKYT